MYGVDDKVVFDRTKLLPPTVDVYVPDEDPPRLYSSNSKGSTVEYEGHTLHVSSYRILSVCGKPFLIGKTETLYSGIMYSSPVLMDSISMLIRHEPKKDKYDWRKPFQYGQPYRFLEKMHKQIGSPILIIYGEVNDRSLSSQVHRYRLSPLFIGPTPEPIPNLSEIKGLAKVYTPEQIYQDISYWVTNVLNTSPDVQPAGAPPQTDKEKIVAHGLDLKQSFRHRKA